MLARSVTSNQLERACRLSVARDPRVALKLHTTAV